MGEAASWVMAAIPGAIVLRGMLAQVDPYDAFLTGARQGLRTGAEICPALAAVMLLLGLMRQSGLTAALAAMLSPMTGWLGLPEEVTPLLLLRPLTGSGSMAALQEIFAACGVDSRAGRIASVLVSSSETICYTMTVYLAGTGVKRLPWVMPISLAAYLAGAATAGFFM